MLKVPKIKQLVIGAANAAPPNARLEVKKSVFFSGLWRLRKALSIKLEPS